VEAAADGPMGGGRNWGWDDGLTEAILPEAEIAASPRLDWRMALENIFDELKKLL
jgi:hypothetical protein